MYDLTYMSHKFDFGKGLENDSKDFRIISSHEQLLSSYDVLIFSDSKGTDINSENIKSWCDLVIEDFENASISYLFVSRPQYMTIVFSFINFFKNNNIKYRYAITNVGFVDFTPKKIDFMNDIASQIPSDKYHIDTNYLSFGKYLLSSGEEAELYTFNYGDIQKTIAKEIDSQFDYIIMMGSLEFSSKIQIERKRPEEFFNQIKVGNDFIFSISQNSSRIHYVQPLKSQIDYLGLLSYDAVHYTPLGHNETYRILKSYINIYFK